MNKSGYLKRALESRDPRFAKILRALGHETEEPQGDAPEAKPGKAKRAYNRRDMRAKD